MAEDRPTPVLQRKAAAGRTRGAENGMPATKALGLGLSKAAQDMMAMELRVTENAQSRQSLAELLETLPEGALLLLLEGPGDALGLVALDAGALTALIEMRTMGRLGKGDPPQRRPTRTDAAVTADFVERALTEFETLLAEEMDIIWAGGFRYASFLEDARPLGLILEDTVYRVFCATLSMGAAGARQGRMVLALPAKGYGPGPKTAEGAAADAAMSPAVGSAAAAAAWATALDAAVGPAPTALDAVLLRLTLPLSAVMALRAGSAVPVPRAALDQIVLEGTPGHRLATGKLGQSRGFRAVRLVSVGAERTPEPTDEVEHASLPPPPRTEAEARLSDLAPVPLATGETTESDMTKAPADTAGASA
jgi:flagellar motor switch protein FliM